MLPFVNGNNPQVDYAAAQANLGIDLPGDPNDAFVVYSFEDWTASGNPPAGFYAIAYAETGGCGGPAYRWLYAVNIETNATYKHGSRDLSDYITADNTVP